VLAGCIGLEGCCIRGNSTGRGLAPPALAVGADRRGEPRLDERMRVQETSRVLEQLDVRNCLDLESAVAPVQTRSPRR